MTDGARLNSRINQLELVAARLTHAERHVGDHALDEWVLSCTLPGTLGMLPIPLDKDQMRRVLAQLQEEVEATLRGLYEDLVANANEANEGGEDE